MKTTTIIQAIVLAGARRSCMSLAKKKIARRKPRIVDRCARNPPGTKRSMNWLVSLMSAESKDYDRAPGEAQVPGGQVRPKWTLTEPSARGCFGVCFGGVEQWPLRRL